MKGRRLLQVHLASALHLSLCENNLQHPPQLRPLASQVRGPLMHEEAGTHCIPSRLGSWKGYFLQLVITEETLESTSEPPPCLVPEPLKDGDEPHVGYILWQDTPTHHSCLTIRHSGSSSLWVKILLVATLSPWTQFSPPEIHKSRRSPSGSWPLNHLSPAVLGPEVFLSLEPMAPASSRSW